MDNRVGRSSREIGHGDKEAPLSKPAKDNQGDECSSLTSGAGSQNNGVSFQPEKNLNTNSPAGWENQNQPLNVSDMTSGSDTISNVNNDPSQNDQDRQSDQEDSSTQSIPESVARNLARELGDRIKGDEISPAELVKSLGNLRKQSSTPGDEEND